jgi:SAM-dependent methyltransferase
VQRVLDVGCGTGRDTQLLLDLIPHVRVVALDASGCRHGAPRVPAADMHASATAEAFTSYSVRMATFTKADLAYLHANFMRADDLCAGRAETQRDVTSWIEHGLLPRPSYVLDDGTWMFPTDYFRLPDDAGGHRSLPVHFARRYLAACRAHRGDSDNLEDDWRAYLTGGYGVCLREVTPEAIVRKGVLVSSLCTLMALARPADAEWREQLRAQVDELDGLERDFSPNYDRDPVRIGRSPTRDLLIAGARSRFPDVFAAPAAT